MIDDSEARFAPWLVEPMLRNRGTYLKVGLAAAMINVFGLITSLFTMTVYDRVVPNSAFASLTALSIGLAIVVVFDFVLRVLRGYFVDMAGADIDAEVGGTVFGRLLSLRLDQRRGSTGALTGMMRELETLRDFFASATLTALVDVPFIVITLVFIAILGGAVVWVPLVAVPVVIGAGWLTRPALDRLAAKSMREGLTKQGVLVETVGALEMVKTSGAGALLGRRWARANREHGDSSTRQRLVSQAGARVAARDAAQQQLALVRPLVERGIEPRVTLIQLQREVTVATNDAAQATAAIARAEAGVAEARAAITQVRETWRAQAGAELATAAAEGAARGSQVRALADRVRRTDVVSPVDGRVNRVLVATVGGSIGAGQPIAEVVPGADTLTVEARVDPKDIASVRIGQRARINVSAYDSAVYGSMQGKVAVISPDATLDERTGESFYTVRVEGDQAGFRDPDGRRLPVGPGMTADVNLIGDRRSVMAYILIPFSRLSERALRE